MSIINAILFYSKKDQKSMRMKNMIDMLYIDLETICVDHIKVRELLLQDEKFGIDEVPTVLIIYSSGHFKTYSSKPLDDWFQQLIINVQREKEKSVEAQIPQAIDYTPIEIPTPEITGIPKELRRKSSITQPIRDSLASPGKEILETDLSQLTIPGAGSIPITGGEIRQIAENEPFVDTDIEEKPTPKGIKKEGLSAKELAQQMEEQRVQFDEKVDQNRPFI